MSVALRCRRCLPGTEAARFALARHCSACRCGSPYQKARPHLAGRQSGRDGGKLQTDPSAASHRCAAGDDRAMLGEVHPIRDISFKDQHVCGPLRGSGMAFAHRKIGLRPQQLSARGASTGDSSTFIRGSLLQDPGNTARPQARVAWLARIARQISPCLTSPAEDSTTHESETPVPAAQHHLAPRPDNGASPLCGGWAGMDLSDI